MTDNVPAVVETRELVSQADTDSWITVLGDVANLANRIAGTEFVPRSLRDSVPAVAAAILYGREVGLPPMTALTQTHVIEGKPAMSAEAMRAMVLAAGHELVIEETTGAVCKMKGRRRGSEHWTSITWTTDMARAAGVLGKQVWKSYPRQMLQARATTELVRLVFPDVIHGFRSLEELDDDGAVEKSAPEPAAPSTTVRRTRKSAATAATTNPPAPREERPEPLTGPPLPGEPGYDVPDAGDSTPPADGTAEESPSGEGGGEAPEPDGDSEARVGEEGAPAVASGGTAGDPDRGPRKSTRSQHRMLHALLTEINGGEKMSDQDRYDACSTIVGRRIGSFTDLTHGNASTLIDMFGRVKTREELDALLQVNIERRNEGDRS